MLSINATPCRNILLYVGVIYLVIFIFARCVFSFRCSLGEAQTKSQCSNLGIDPFNVYNSDARHYVLRKLWDQGRH